MEVRVEVLVDVCVETWSETSREIGVGLAF